MTWRGPAPALAGLLVLAGLLAPGTAVAQGRGNGVAGVKVRLSPRIVAFPTPGVVEFDAGGVDASALVVSVEPRRNQGPWELRIRTDDPDLGGTGKPVTDLLWRAAGSSTWTPLTATDQMVVQGTGARTVTIHLRLRLDYASDSPAAYSADIVFHAEAL